MWIRLSLLILLFAACNQHSGDKHTDANTQHDSTGHATDSLGQGPASDIHRAMTRMMNEMKNLPVSGDADRDFAAVMRLHHQSALEMARAELAGGTDSTIRSIAAEIIEVQQREISAFDEFISRHGDREGRSELIRKMMAVMSDQHAAPHAGGSVDEYFTNLMIIHHEEGIRMAEEYLKEGKDPGLRKIAGDIISGQQKEIDRFRRWLATWQGPAPQHL